MTHLIENRRDFLRQAATAMFTFPLLAGCKIVTLAETTGSDVLTLIKKNAKPTGTEGMGAIDAPPDVSWKTMLARGNDGEQMIVSGTVFQPDGKTPAPNVLIYFYHTDIYGIYGRTGEPKHGKYRGWMLTDKAGRYEFRTVRPASYPNTTISAHVHMTLTGTDFKEDWIEWILFEGDKFVTAREREMAGRRGGFNPIIHLAPGGDVILHGRRDIQLMTY